ncbi:MAG: S8 family serine peptidase [Vicinamibacterales bacterium]
MRKFLITLVGALLVAAAVGPYVQAQRPGNAIAIMQAVADGRASASEVLIQFRPGTNASDQRDARGLVNAQRKELLRGGPDGEVELAELPFGVPLGNAIALLAQHPRVAFAEPNWIYQHEATSNDPYFTDGSLWGMYGPSPAPAPNNAFGSRAAEAWAAGYTGSNTVVVGVIDEGINWAHEDLAANIWTNPGETVDGIDNDGNGYVDDIRGWDFVNNDNSVYDGNSSQLSIDAHGTHVSGTIGGQGGNGKGVAGVNWNVKIISAKFLGTSGGTTANAVKAVDYLTNLKTRHNLNLVATSNSWGGGGFSQALLDAIERAADQNILFIAAAGNSSSNNDSTASYPSNYDTTGGTSLNYDAVIAVAALGGSGTLASFSSYGATKVDLAAPGVGIYSSTPGNQYSSYSGTSMATPHVTGAAALYRSVNPSATAAQIRSAILATVTPTAALSGMVATGGRLNVCGLLGVAGCTPPPVVAPPTNLLVTGVTGLAVSLSWNASSGADSYNVLRSTTSGGPYTLVAPGVVATSSVDTVPAAGTYYYVVQAVDGINTSASSNQVSASPGVQVPAAPSNLTVTVPKGKKQLSLSWPVSSGATSYSIYRCVGTCGTATVPPFSALGSVTATSVTVTGLQSGVRHYFYVRAVNAAGAGAPSPIKSGTPR